MELYENRIPIELYRKINRDKTVNWDLRSDNVGKCVQLLDDYLSTTDSPTKLGWEDYYFKVRDKKPLVELSDLIVRRHNIDLTTAKRYVHFRIIGQTWNGIANEHIVINELKQFLPDIDFVKADIIKDEKFFTDWEGYKDDDLLFGLQIKPLSYFTMNTPYQIKARENHKVQADSYKEIYKVPHYIAYYDNGKGHHIYELSTRIESEVGHDNH